MNLYEFVDNWQQSYCNPDNYQQKYSREDVVSGIKDFSRIWLKNPLSDELLKKAVHACCDCIKVDQWKAASFKNKLKKVDMGPAVFEEYSLSPDEEAIAKKMLQSGVHIISEAQASEIFDSRDSDGHYHSPSASLLQIDKEDGKPAAFVAIDNRSGDAWTEDFKTIKGAQAWLNGASLESVQEDYPEEKPDKSLQDLCDEPIVGDVMIGGVHIVVDPKLTDLTYNEAVNYIELCEKQKGNKTDRITEIVLEPREGDNIYIDWTVKPLPFDRIRRITGFLVGDLNRWNNAKRQEEQDRVKHGLNKMSGLALTAFAALFLQLLKDIFTIFDR